MEDLDDVRRASGVVADFSNWTGISAGDNFKHMKITNKEQVFGPTEEQIENNETVREETTISSVRSEEGKVVIDESAILPIKPEENKIELNYDNVKDIAIRLLPTIDKIDMSNYTTYISNAIEVAKYFEKGWSLIQRS